MLRDRLGFSERRACRYVGQRRSTQRHVPARAADEAALTAALRELASRRPRWGYRRAHAALRADGWAVNRKRVQRLWRQEGLRVPQRARKRRRLGEGAGEQRRLRARHPNEVWAIDFMSDQTADGRMLRVLNVVDEFTREALAMHVDRSITADQTVAVLDQLAGARGAPGHIRCDNGPELTAHALQDWCRLRSTVTGYIEPGAPWQNPFVESFNARVRDELLNAEEFSCLTEARMLAADWRTDYNHHHPHSALGMQPAALFAAAWARTPGAAA